MTQAPPPSPMATPMPWDLVATAYTAELVPIFQRFSRDALRLAAPPAAGRVVDVACGPGSLSLLAAAEGLTVDAIDFSPEMLAKLTAHDNARITAQLGDGQALPYPDASFDAAFSMFGLMFFPERAKGFAELRRVLRPGARAVVSSWVPLSQVPILGAVFAGIGTGMAALQGKPAGPPAPSPLGPLSTPELCVAEMSASFADVEVHRIEHTAEYASPDAYWESVERTTAPLVLMRKNMGEQSWAIVREHARAAVHAAADAGQVLTTLPALLTVGTAR